jgi:hypothetical protein
MGDELEISLSGSPESPSSPDDSAGSESDLEAARLSGSREVLRALEGRDAKRLLTALTDLVFLIRTED